MLDKTGPQAEKLLVDSEDIGPDEALHMGGSEFGLGRPGGFGFRGIRDWS